MTSQKLKGTKFQITWTTDVPANSEVLFTCYGPYINSTLVTSHKMQFSGTVGYYYEYTSNPLMLAGSTPLRRAPTITRIKRRLTRVEDRRRVLFFRPAYITLIASVVV